MRKIREGLLFKFGIIFFVFTLITLGMSGVSTFLNQTYILKHQKETSIQNVTRYLEDVLASGGDDFPQYIKYIIKHHEEINIPMNFDENDIRLSRAVFESKFANAYPGKVLGIDIHFDQLNPEVQKAYATYYHEYYLDLFEKARTRFGLIYTYFTVPTGEPYHMYYVLDAVREARSNNSLYINLCIDVPQPLQEHKTQWEAWETGRRPKGYDYYDNEFGKTYAYYSPLIINGEKIGVVAADVEIANVNREILENSIRQVFYIGVILVIAVVLLLYYIYHKYISKLSRLKDNIQLYSQGKNAEIVKEIEKNASGKDEISVLAMQVSAMIMELENYMRSLLETAKELRDTQQRAEAMNELANKDALTGIRNKTAYDNEVRQIDWTIAEGNAEFAIAMIDLNYLKRINDTYGHEHGNTAIKKLCWIVCHVFEHSPVFRVGGDEFVVILRNDDYKNMDELVKEFNNQISEISCDKNLNVWERISAAIGIGVFDIEMDSAVENVFRRADKAMYQRKKEMKSVKDI